ncbi:MAG TPA: phosphohistidine phosphatase SixA [Candidatus Bilamarchaeum sp.]|nr:phosphohistidine phosphatase SixA [Candidatus Bilamarchaeum sp.]
MRLYLVQHGQAVSEAEDPERPLSATGRAECEKVAARAAGLVEVSRIYHSKKLRARETAEIFAAALKAQMSEFQDLSPNDDPSLAADLVRMEGKDLMLVGHLPHLERLSSLLLCGDAGAGIVSFRMGAVVCLEKDDKWRLKWIFTPEMVL